jgi:AhpD family alkylhydroperoxidase
MRLGVDEVGVTELMGVTEHSRAMATAAAAVLLDAFESEAALITPLAPDECEQAVEGLLVEVSAWTLAAMGRRSVPTIWRIFARNPYYLEATWRKETSLMTAGALPARDKRRVALAVAMATRSRYMIEYHAAVLRHGGDTDRDLLEVLGVVDHYTTLNTLSEAMQIESDIRPPVENP